MNRKRVVSILLLKISILIPTVQVFSSKEINNHYNGLVSKNLSNDKEITEYKEIDPNIFQHVEFPINVPYRDVMRKISKKIISGNQYSGSKNLNPSNVEHKQLYKGKYSNQVDDKYVYVTPEDPKTVARKFIKIDIPKNRIEDPYRLLGNDAERAFITRGYGFINLTYGNLNIDTLIEHIENLSKIVKDYELYRGKTPISTFDSWETEKKSFFCEYFVGNSILLRKDKVFYDKKRANEIRLVNVRIYSKELSQKLLNHKRKVEMLPEYESIVQCPCLENDIEVLIGLSPVYYKNQKTVNYVFTYDPVDFTPDDLMYSVTIRSLSRLDEKRVEQEKEELKQANMIIEWLESFVKPKMPEEKKTVGTIEWFLPKKWKKLDNNKK